MNLRHRPMQPDDIPECVDVIASHPVIGPRYGKTIELLAEAWLRTLECQANFATVFHVDEGSRSQFCFFGVPVALNDEFVREMKASPQFWAGPELARRVVAGRSPLLADAQLRNDNSRGGLNLVIWESLVCPGYEAQTQLQRYMMSVFIEVHQGYLWKELISQQSESPERLAFILNTGGLLWDPIAGRYTSERKEELAAIAGRPHITGTTRDLELKRQGGWEGTWVGALFDYRPPVLGFSRSEQHLLSSALPGATDEHLAEILETSLPAVKKSWVSIYRRVEDSLPELIGPTASDIPANGRGREKRRSLLTYLRAHPEELRPVSRKLLGKAAQ